MSDHRRRSEARAMMQNRRGEWVPAIPLPLQGILHKRCHCGRKFWTMEGYRAHYALAHIVDPEEASGEDGAFVDSPPPVGASDESTPRGQSVASASLDLDRLP